VPGATGFEAVLGCRICKPYETATSWQMKILKNRSIKIMNLIQWSFSLENKGSFKVIYVFKLGMFSCFQPNTTAALWTTCECFSFFNTPIY